MKYLVKIIATTEEDSSEVLSQALEWDLEGCEVSQEATYVRDLGVGRVEVGIYLDTDTEDASVLLDTALEAPPFEGEVDEEETSVIFLGK